MAISKLKTRKGMTEEQYSRIVAESAARLKKQAETGFWRPEEGEVRMLIYVKREEIPSKRSKTGKIEQLVFADPSDLGEVRINVTGHLSYELQRINAEAGDLLSILYLGKHDYDDGPDENSKAHLWQAEVVEKAFAIDDGENDDESRGD